MSSLFNLHRNSGSFFIRNVISKLEQQSGSYRRNIITDGWSRHPWFLNETCQTFQHKSLPEQSLNLYAALVGGFVVISTDDADKPSHCENQNCGSLYPNIILRGMQASSVPTSGILVIGGVYQVRLDGYTTHVGGQDPQLWASRPCIGSQPPPPSKMQGPGTWETVITVPRKLISTETSNVKIRSARLLRGWFIGMTCPTRPRPGARERGRRSTTVRTISIVPSAEMNRVISSNNVQSCFE